MPVKRHTRGAPGGKGGQFAPDPVADDPAVGGADLSLSDPAGEVGFGRPPSEWPGWPDTRAFETPEGEPPRRVLVYAKTWPAYQFVDGIRAKPQRTMDNMDYELLTTIYLPKVADATPGHSQMDDLRYGTDLLARAFPPPTGADWAEDNPNLFGPGGQYSEHPDDYRRFERHLRESWVRYARSYVEWTAGEMQMVGRARLPEDVQLDLDDPDGPAVVSEELGKRTPVRIPGSYDEFTDGVLSELRSGGGSGGSFADGFQQHASGQADTDGRTWAETARDAADKSPKYNIEPDPHDPPPHLIPVKS